MSEASIDLSSLKPELRDAISAIAELSRAAGGRALMVGGAVRDLLLGAKDVKDVDIEVFGIEPQKLQDISSNCSRQVVSSL